MTGAKKYEVTEDDDWDLEAYNVSLIVLLLLIRENFDSEISTALSDGLFPLNLIIAQLKTTTNMLLKEPYPASGIELMTIHSTAK